MRTRNVALALGLLAVAATLRLSFAGDPADDAFDSPEVKEIAARADAMKLDDEVALLKRIQRSLDVRLLAPTDAEWRGFESLRGRTDAGLARILCRVVSEGLCTPRCGGAYWSFSRRSNDYNKSPQIGLEQSQSGGGRMALHTGFSGGDTGLIVRLRETGLLDVSESMLPEELRFKAEDVYPTARGPDWRKYVPDAEVGGVYALRSVLWDQADVLVAFQVVRMDNYGATIAWRILKTYDVPKRPNRPARLGEGGRGGGQNGKDGDSGK